MIEEGQVETIIENERAISLQVQMKIEARPEQHLDLLRNALLGFLVR